jgi:hypothetical protein
MGLAHLKPSDAATKILQILDTVPETDRANELIRLIGGYVGSLNATDAHTLHADAMILILERGLPIISDEHILKPLLLSELGDSFHTRFKLTGEIADIEMLLTTTVGRHRLPQMDTRRSRHF